MFYLREEAHINITAFSAKPIEGRAENKERCIRICPHSSVNLGPEGNLLVHRAEPLLPTVEQLHHVLGQPAVLAGSLEGKLKVYRAAEHLGHGSKRVWVRAEALPECRAWVGEDVRGGKLLVGKVGSETLTIGIIVATCGRLPSPTWTRRW